MLLSYYVTDVMSLITLDIYIGRCYCHLISGRCCPLGSSVADEIADFICIMFILMADVIAI